MFAASQLPPHQLFAACGAQEFAGLERQAPRRIAETQARKWVQAIRNCRKLEKTTAEIRRVSLRILQETTLGVPALGKRGRKTG